MRLSKGLGLGLMLSRGGLGNELCFYDHRKVSSLGKWGAILLASVISSGLYFCYPIDDGGGYSFVIVASFAFLSLFFLPLFPLFFCRKRYRGSRRKPDWSTELVFFMFYIFRYLYLDVISHGKAWAPLVLYLQWSDPFSTVYLFAQRVSYFTLLIYINC